MAENTNTERDALLPCPFCGGDARNGAHADDCYFMLYRKFNNSGADMSLAFEVLDAWNRRASLPLPAAGQEPVAYRYKDARGHWRYVGAPLTKGWDFPQNLNHEPLYAAPQPAVAAGWVSVKERLPGWAVRDDTPCFINNEEVPPTLTSETVLVALKGGGVRTDKLTTIEGKSDGWWHTYGERVVAWMPLPPAPSTEGESNG